MTTQTELPAWVADWWKSIDSAPTDGTTILGYWCNGEMHTGSIYDGEWIPAWEQPNEWAMPSHWMPLPPDPIIARADGESA